MKLAVMLTAALLGPGAYAQTAPGPLGLTAEQLDDADLIDSQGRKIGEVENLMLGPKGDVVGLVVEIDQRTPKPDRRVQVELSSLRAVPDPTDPGEFNVQTSQTREQLLALPEAR
ncbi:PRC-barrel domain-containing protein [Phenylobacterium sp.]|uniref:PRC-barrel domain-containing protein n=1 Tax=Phenylobacterium sp. TaxID=1871053 RepID=UPI0035AD8B7B